MPKYIVALTGASGIIYGVRLVEELLQRDLEVHLIISEPACLVARHELGWELNQPLKNVMRKYLPFNNLFIYENAEIDAPIASGSFITNSMIVVPCTMSSISTIAHGISKNLLERAADVMIKEKRPLIVVPRETPLSVIHLKNMLSLAEMGVHVIPAMPAFYSQPQKVEDMVSFVVGKILDAINIEHNLFRRYHNGKDME